MNVQEASVWLESGWTAKRTASPITELAGSPLPSRPETSVILD